MRTLRDAVTAVAARARKFSDRGLGEQNVKASLIAPILTATKKSASASKTKKKGPRQ